MNVVTFEDRVEMLALVARALVGCEVELVGVEGRLDGVRPSMCCGTSVELPLRTGSQADRVDDGRVLRGLLLLQLGLRVTDSDEDDEARRVAYQGAPAIVRRLASVLEEVRAAHHVLRTWPGARRDLVMLWSVPVPPRRSAARAMVHALRGHVLGDSLAPPDAALAHFLEKARAGDATWRDSLSLAAHWLAERRTGGSANANSLPVRGRVEVGAPHDTSMDAAAVQAEAAHHASNAGGTGEAPAAAAPGPGTASGTSTQVTTGRAPAGAPRFPSGRASMQVPPASDSRGTSPFWYPEWDEDRHVLRPHWCRVLQRDGSERDASALRKALAAARPTLDGARRDLARTAPARPSRNLVEDGTDFDLDALIAECVDRRAGGGGSTRLHRDIERPAPDVAILVVVDASASTDHVLSDDDAPAIAAATTPEDEGDFLWSVVARRTPAVPPPRRRVIDLARESVAAVLDLAGFDLAAAACAYTGQGRLHVRLDVLQPFGTAHRERTLRRLAGLAPGGATRTGAALRHAHAQLRARPESRRLLVLVTDGYPQDEDYGSDGDVRYGVADTRHAWRALRAAGIEPLCVAIDPAGYDFHAGFCARGEVVQATTVSEVVDAVALALRSER